MFVSGDRIATLMKNSLYNPIKQQDTFNVSYECMWIYYLRRCVVLTYISDNEDPILEMLYK